MLKREEQAILIKYEVEHIKYFNNLEKQLNSIFGMLEYCPNVPCQNFNLLYFILDDLGIPPDSEKTPRDEYNNLYCDLCWSDKITEKDINAFLDNVLRLKGKKNETKKRIRK
jgi:hypothetical protein